MVVSVVTSSNFYFSGSTMPFKGTVRSGVEVAVESDNPVFEGDAGLWFLIVLKNF